MANEEKALRLFVCLKTRTDGRHCCSASQAAHILSRLRTDLASEGQLAAHIDVRPSGCLDRCEEGPVVMGFLGKLAEEAVPSKFLLKRSLDAAAYTFTQLTEDDIPGVIRTLLGNDDDKQTQS